ncbi:hypothetical protein HRF59_04950 [Bacillus velezensis]|uniref:hypothetical protein n=1 Tax=Bacillus TaxID=1386 RepID=UPI0004A7B8AB|nr:MULTISPECIES: hypothetical protein [Bacillus]AUS16068.1 hypothetical protein C0W57_07715 [Bacillus velezensis]NHN20965.1 hypothetical protein [Bacillus amyloliquefaciens]NRG13044.1 hypothetical protein [Bacillus velezensis]UHC66513.1 hypothetical protein K3G25_07910 [Bacillus sp. FCW2]URD66562.1 hypothetical protein M8X21_21235 [Bacillus velezensis]
MKIIYKGFEIVATRNASFGGWENIYYTVMHKTGGWFLEDSFCECEDKIEDFVNGLTLMVDDYLNNDSDVSLTI